MTTPHGALGYPRHEPPPPAQYHLRGRYGRLFPLRPFASDCRDVREALMTLGGADGPMNGEHAETPNNVTLPAGFTYLGQFIAHDLTYDPSSSLQQQRDPASVEDYRTPALDLDSIYGGGPFASPYLYDRDGASFLIDEIDSKVVDFPRNGNDVAIVADPRNDANVLVAQLTLAFMKFHNYVVRDVVRENESIERFLAAQRLVRWHYQWIVLHEYLPRTVGEATLRVLREERYRFFRWMRSPFIPVEFSAAAFRFGHTQIRPQYHIHESPDHRGLFVPVFATEGGPPANGRGDLAGGPIAGRYVEWDRLFDMGRHTDLEGHVQLSRRLDTHLAGALFELPASIRQFLQNSEVRTVAQRDLLRHLTFSLPSGQTVAGAMGVPPLGEEAFSKLRGLACLQESTPLWYYILREAELLGNDGYAAADSTTGPYGDRKVNQTLGPVGGRIVAEVLVGLLEADATSLLHQEARWRPTLGKEAGTFGIADLLERARVPLSGDDAIR
jgi:hypothetical protein